MMIKNRVLIGGGTGFIGTQLSDYLQRKGYMVQKISRQPSFFNVTWDSLAKNGLHNQTKVIINLSGRNVLDLTKRWNKQFQDEVYRSRIETNKKLAELIDKSHHKPDVFISMSGVGIYKPIDSVVHDENSLIEEYDFFSRLCIDWEKAALLSSSPSVRQSILRSGIVIGKTGGIIKEIRIPFSLGLGGKMGSGMQYMPWVHIDDFCRIVDFLIENRRLSGIFNAVGPQFVTNQMFTDHVKKIIGKPALLDLPEAVLNFIFSNERAKMLTVGPKVVPKRLLNSGFHFEFDTLWDALREALR